MFRNINRFTKFKRCFKVFHLLRIHVDVEMCPQLLQQVTTGDYLMLSLQLARRIQFIINMHCLRLPI